MRISVWTAWFVLAAVLPAGCGDGAVGTADSSKGSPTGKQALDDLAELLKGVAEQKKRPPAKPADLQPYEAIHLGATLGISQQEIVYAWGSGLTGGQTVIAYEKNAATAGGWVLQQDGTVKQMTVAEFSAAPKAAGGAGKK